MRIRVVACPRSAIAREAPIVEQLTSAEDILECDGVAPQARALWRSGLRTFAGVGISVLDARRLAENPALRSPRSDLSALYDRIGRLPRRHEAEVQLQGWLPLCTLGV
jgi:hypothetical protein